MSLKMKLLSLVDAYASPKLIGSCDCVGNNTYAKLKPLLEGIHIVKWPCQFFDIERRCKFEGLSRVSSYVYILPLVNPNLESRKRMCVVGLYFVFDSSKLHSRGG